MTEHLLSIIDPDTGEERLISYSELEEDVRQQLIKPIGGFVFGAEDFKEIKLGEFPFYLAGWLPVRGKSMIYAPTKSGKSFLGLQMARCIGAGEPFLGLQTTIGRTLYIQFELGEEVLQQRMIATNQTYDNVFVGTTFSMKLDKEGGQQQLLKALDSVEPNVFILDPLYKAISGDENEAQDMMKVLDFLDAVIESYHCSVQVFHHTGKDTSKRGRGSSVMEDWVDSQIKMQAINKDGDPLRVKIKPVFLRHAPLPKDGIEAELVNFEFQVVDKKSVKTLVADFIHASTESVEPKQLFEQKIGSNTSVYTALKELTKEGKIKKSDWGKYEWIVV